MTTSTSYNCIRLLDGSIIRLREGGDWDAKCDLVTLQNNAARCQGCFSIYHRLRWETDQRGIQAGDIHLCRIETTATTATQLLVTSYMKYKRSRSASQQVETLLLALHYATIDPHFPSVAAICDGDATPELCH
jgi:hypothetical protein